MIDISADGLPDAIECDGEVFSIRTDFRVWLRFSSLLGKGVAWYGIFDGDRPSGDGWIEQAVSFMESKNELPRERRATSARTLDYDIDGELIVASFQQAYGIDITDKDTRIHWHRFLALLRGLPDDTCLSRVMSYRAWVRGERKHETVMAELRDAWRLPEPGEDAQRAALLKWAEDTIG